jgi:hypothetical protein
MFWRNFHSVFCFQFLRVCIQCCQKCFFFHFVSNFGFFDKYLAILAKQVLVALKICFFSVKTQNTNNFFYSPPASSAGGATAFISSDSSPFFRLPARSTSATDSGILLFRVSGSIREVTPAAKEQSPKITTGIPAWIEPKRSTMYGADMDPRI